jgi:hypothetical protein
MMSVDLFIIQQILAGVMVERVQHSELEKLQIKLLNEQWINRDSVGAHQIL